MKRLFVAGYMLAVIAFFILTACDSKTEKKESSFIQIGGFAVNRISPERTDVKDGAGRTFVLIPRSAGVPADVQKSSVIRVPVQSVAAYGYFEVATLKVLGVLEQTLVGVTYPASDWFIPEVRKGFEDGKIIYLGDASHINFELLKKQKPELVLTWDHSVIPMLDELGIPCVITTTPTAMCMNARMRFVQFLAPFFRKEKEALIYFDRVNNALLTLRERVKEAVHEPRVMWGDIYEKRVLVEPGNAWVGELVELLKSDYLFTDVSGTSCIEISLERFFSSGMEADIFFTYRTARDGVTSKAALARLNPLIADIRPIKEGRVYSPMPHYKQSGDKLDEILTEISAILHPELYTSYKLHYFAELPDTEQDNGGSKE